jgi:hypothetical protein
MCNSFTTPVSKRHNRLAEVVGVMRGRIVQKTDIDHAWNLAFPTLVKDTQWIILSDHCVNHTNKGACRCAKTELALFERLSRGIYRIL